MLFLFTKFHYSFNIYFNWLPFDVEGIYTTIKRFFLSQNKKCFNLEKRWSYRYFNLYEPFYFLCTFGWFLCFFVPWLFSKMKKFYFSAISKERSIFFQNSRWRERMHPNDKDRIQITTWFKLSIFKMKFIRFTCNLITIIVIGQFILIIVDVNIWYHFLSSLF